MLRFEARPCFVGGFGFWRSEELSVSGKRKP